MCEMVSKKFNNNNKQPQLGCVKWVAKNLTTTTTNNLNWDNVKWMAKTSTTPNKQWS
jgi:hypothetical protein